MRIMANRAFAYGSGAMDVFVIRLFRMAGQAEVFDRLGEKLRLLGLMGIMAGRAHPLFDRSVEGLHRTGYDMTSITQLRHRIDETDGLRPVLRIRRRGRQMADRALIRRTVEVLRTGNGDDWENMLFRRSLYRGCCCGSKPSRRLLCGSRVRRP